MVVFTNLLIFLLLSKKFGKFIFYYLTNLNIISIDPIDETIFYIEDDKPLFTYLNKDGKISHNLKNYIDKSNDVIEKILETF